MSQHANVLTGNLVKLTLGDTQFLLPQEDVVKTGYLQLELVAEPKLEGLLCPSYAVQIDEPTDPVLSDEDFLNAEINEETLPQLSLSPKKTPEPVTLPESSYYIALSPQLQLMTHCPKNRFLLTTLAGTDWQWCWDNVEVLLDANINMTPVPDRLACDYTPILGLVMMDGKPVFQTSAERILAYVAWQMAL